jgi:LPS-assembly lipoprotein
MRPVWRRRAAAWAAACLAIALIASGFHLRGSYSLPEALIPIDVEAPAGSGTAKAVRDALRRQQGALTTDAAKASATLVIMNENEDRRVLSVDDSANVAEYEIRKTVRWRLERKKGEARETALAPSRLRVRRDYQFDPQAVLSKSQEERTLYNEMERELAQRILSRVGSWSPSQQ